MWLILHISTYGNSYIGIAWIVGTSVFLIVNLSGGNVDKVELFSDCIELTLAIPALMSGIFAFLVATLVRSPVIWGHIYDFRTYIATGAFIEIISTLFLIFDIFNVL